MLAGIAVTSAGHYLTPRDMRLWHGIFQRLYYLPVVYAAIAFGWGGGLAAAILAAVLYVPHILITWRHEHNYAMEQYAEIFMFLAVGHGDRGAYRTGSGSDAPSCRPQRKS